MRTAAAIVAALLLATVAGSARAEDDETQRVQRVVDRSLLLPKKSFGVDASFRGADGADGAMFEYLFGVLEFGTGSGVTDIKFGMDLVASQPSESDLDVLEKMHLRLATGVGTGGIIALRLESFKPTTEEAIKPQFVDLGVVFKRALNLDAAIIAGGGFDFAYLLFPQEIEPEDPVWMTRFYLVGGGQYQLTPAVAAEATLSVHIPIAQSPDEGEPDGLQLDTTALARLRGYYTLSSSFDAYVELSFNSDDEPLASVGETKSASLGIRGAL
jgi:hypothetical protein